VRGERSNIKAGIASLAAVTGLALAIWAWNAVQRSRRVEYTVEFTAEQGVYGIGTGTGVVIGGLARGQVTGIRPRIAGGELKSYEVTLAIDPEVPLYEGMRFRATAGGINGDAQVEIYDTGRAKAVFGGAVGKDTRRPLDRDRVHVATKRDPMRDWFGAEGAALLGMTDRLQHRPHVLAAHGFGIGIADTQRVIDGGNAGRRHFGVMPEQSGKLRPAHLGARHHVALEIVGMQFDQAGNQQVTVKVAGPRH